VFDDSSRQWLRHPETGGYFNCPTEAIDVWKAKGWEESDPPEELNPAIAERNAFLAQQAASAEANKAAAAESDDSKTRTTKSTKSAAKSEEK
jgi:hypothetical protein